MDITWINPAAFFGSIVQGEMDDVTTEPATVASDGTVVEQGA